MIRGFTNYIDAKRDFDKCRSAILRKDGDHGEYILFSPASEAFRHVTADLDARVRRL